MSTRTGRDAKARVLEQREEEAVWTSCVRISGWINEKSAARCRAGRFGGGRRDAYFTPATVVEPATSTKIGLL
jgi:hypothetical protein